MEEPQMRASHVHSNLLALEALGADPAARVRKSIPDTTLEAIEASSRVAWLPLGLDLELTLAIERVLGEGTVRSWSRDALRRSMEGPLLKPLIAGAVRLFGLKPELLFKLAPRAWTAIYRHCGDLEIARAEPGHVVLQLNHAPEPMCDAVYLEGVAGAFEALFDVCSMSGRVEVSDLQPGAGTAVFDVLWAP